jgi:hypothetical protein
LGKDRDKEGKGMACSGCGQIESLMLACLLVPVLALHER